MKKNILLLLLFLPLAGQTQCDCKYIYVWKFNDISRRNSQLEKDMADAFEEVLTSQKKCIVLERRSYATILLHEENEKRIQAIEDISPKNIKNLKAIKANIVVLATTRYEGADTLSRNINVKFVNIFTKQILANKSISKPSLDLTTYTGIELALKELMSKMCEEPFLLSDINIQDTVKESKGLLLDLDPMEITWKSTGPFTEMEVCLENVETLKRTPVKKVNSREGALTFPNNRYESYSDILKTRMPGEKNRIRVLFFPKSEKQVVSREFNIYVGITLTLIGFSATHLEAIPVVDGTQIKAFAFKTELILITPQNKIAAHLTTPLPTSSPGFNISETLVRQVNWNRVLMLSNCIRKGIDDRMIRQEFMLDKQRNIQ